MAHKLTLEQRIERAHVRFMRHPKFALASGVFVLGKTEVIDREEAFNRGLPIPTAGTDGWDTFYIREWCDQFDDKELAFIIIHENFHKMYKHSFLWQKLYEEDPMIAGQACDHVINLQIVESDPNEELVSFPMLRDKDGNKLPIRNGCYNEEFRGMDAGQVFRAIKKKQEQEEKECEGEGKGKGKGKQYTQKSFDDHRKAGSGNEGDGQRDGDEKDDNGNSVTQHLTKEQMQALQEKIEEAVRQGVILSSKLMGQGAGGLDRSIRDLLEPKIDWRDVLKEFIISNCAGKDVSSWKRLNKRYRGLGLNLPTSEAHNAGHIINGIDTSGSVGQELLKEFLSENKALCETLNPERYSLLYWDSYVERAEEYLFGESQDMAGKTRPRGGGGTDPNAVCNWIRENVKEKEKINAVVIMTDGYVPGWGNWQGLEHIPVLWLIVGDNNAVPTHGVSVKVK